MSASTSSYSNLLSGMWAPEGSEMNDRLRRLQELEIMRKEREAKRQEILNNRGQARVISRSARVKNVDPVSTTKPVEAESEGTFSLSAGLGLRRAMSFREDSENKENYGGARPKVGGFSGANQEDDNWGSLFSDVKSSIVGPRRTLKTDTTSRKRYDSTDSEDSVTSSSYSQSKIGLSDRPLYSSYSRSVSQPLADEGGTFLSGRNPKSAFLQNYLQKNGGLRLNEGNYDNEQSQQVEYLQTDEQSNFNGHQEQNGHEIHEYEDEGEEPLHFIERLKNGSRTTSNSHNSSNFVIPTVPPLQQYSDNETKQESENIISVAKDISSAFGMPSPTTPTRQSIHTVDNPNVTATYEIVETNYDSSGDEAGKILPIKNNGRLSEWMVVESGPGDLDEIQAFFTGKAVEHDPNISRVLDGEKLRAEFEQSFSSPKETPVKEQRAKESDAESESGKKKLKPKVAKKPTLKNRSVDKLKTSPNGMKSSGSENDSRPNSENEGEMVEKISRTGNASSKTSPPTRTDRSISLTDNLSRLESMTQEKLRRKSVDENEKKSVPSYMSSTNSSKRKYTKGKDVSPKPYSRDLKKDVRELRKFVRENSLPNTPVTSAGLQPVDIVIEAIEKKVTREISVQTDVMFNIDNAYVCKHCGKSSAEEVITLLTQENLELTSASSKASEKVRGKETNFSSKDSVKSLGELSSKSDKTHVKPKFTAASSASYMKGTTASRLKTNGSESTNGKIISPEVMLYPDNNSETKKSKTSSKSTVSQKAKSFESRGKNKPTLSVFRGTSAERGNTEPDLENKRSKLSKSKSVDQVYMLKNTQKKSGQTNLMKETKSSKAKQNGDKMDFEVIDLTTVHSPRTPVRSKKPAVSPRSAPTSPRRKEVLDISVESIKSKGQFTTIEDNPFIKNDSKHSPRGKTKRNGESVWTRSRSREPSESRSDYTADTADTDKQSVGTSSAGEGRSLSHLSWSDSGSTESLNKSKSESHGSNTSLNDKQVFEGPRSRNTSTSSSTSHNAVLNLLSANETKQNPESVPLETDVDAVFSKGQKDRKSRLSASEHNEESVERAHLEFAKKACHLLDTEIIKRDSSNESGEKNGTITETTKPKNGTGNGVVPADDKNSKNTGGATQKKGKKGFLKGKGKIFRK